MPPRFNSPTRRFARAVWVAGTLTLAPVLSAAAQQTSGAPASDAAEPQLKAWHENLRFYAPLESGCFHTSYPSVQWEKVACGTGPAFVSAHKHAAEAARAAHGGRIPLETAGNGNDYVAQTAGITQSGLGTFPSVRNVTSE